MLTRCPHCQATFQVTAQQLEVAAGKVRCGACMKVFDALASAQALGGTAASKATAPATSRKPESAPAPKPTPLEEDDLLFLDNPDEDEKEGSYTRKKPGLDQFELSDTFLALDEGGPLGQTAFTPDDDGAPVDESWAEDILEESAVNRRANTNQHAPRETPVYQPPAPSTPAAPPPEPSFQMQPRPAADEAPMYGERDIPPPYKPTPTSKPASVSPYSGLRSAPIAVKQASSGRLRQALLALLALTLLAALAVQVVWFERDQYSQIPQLRPYYATLCDLMKCRLPPLIDLDQVHSEKLVVRSHPNQKRALMVDANIVNRARFPQPLPAIALTFSDLSDRVVAQRLFQPSEYLQGEAKDLAYMPVDTPIRISLEVKDPGRDAVNYSIRFFPSREERTP